MGTINVKDLVRGGYDPTPKTPRELDPREPIPSVELPEKAYEKYDVPAEKLIAGLDEIASRYSDSVEAKAKAYAENRYRGEFDTDEEIWAKAKEHLDGIYEGKTESIANTRDAKISEANERKAEYASDRAAAIAKITGKYDRAVQSNLEDMSRRGLSRSSIAELSRENLASGYREEVRATEEAYDRKVRVLDKKIEQANAAHAAALKNYEISYAIRLEDKIDRLTKERDRAVSEYRDEHSEERKRAYNYYLMRDSSQNKLYEQEHGDYDGEKKQNYQERYDYLVGALEGKSSSAIERFLRENESDLRRYLGLYYQRFVAAIS